MEKLIVFLIKKKAAPKSSPVAERPSKSVATKPAAEKPVATKSAAKKPAATQPSVEESAAQPTATAPRKPVNLAELSPVVNGQVQVKISDQDKAKTPADRYRDAVTGSAVAELFFDGPSIESKTLVIREAYRQVFGNAYVMDSERLPIIESQFMEGKITVLEFVRQLAKSSLYQSLFWDKYSNVTVIQLNFKHLLGRAPESQAEISEHIEILANGGFEAEIDSYLDSDEYLQAFGQYQVPYARSYSSQTGKNVVGFTHGFALTGMACSSNKSSFTSTPTSIDASQMQNKPGTIPELRAVPDSFPAELNIAPEPRVPREWRAAARQLLLKNNYSAIYRNKYGRSPSFN